MRTFVLSVAFLVASAPPKVHAQHVKGSRFDSNRAVTRPIDFHPEHRGTVIALSDRFTMAERNTIYRGCEHLRLFLKSTHYVPLKQGKQSRLVRFAADRASEFFGAYSTQDGFRVARQGELNFMQRAKQMSEALESLSRIVGYHHSNASRKKLNIEIAAIDHDNDAAAKAVVGKYSRTVVPRLQISIVRSQLREHANNKAFWASVLMHEFLHRAGYTHGDNQARKRSLIGAIDQAIDTSLGTRAASKGDYACLHDRWVSVPFFERLAARKRHFKVVHVGAGGDNYVFAIVQFTEHGQQKRVVYWYPGHKYVQKKTKEPTWDYSAVAGHPVFVSVGDRNNVWLIKQGGAVDRQVSAWRGSAFTWKPDYKLLAVRYADIAAGGVAWETTFGGFVGGGVKYHERKDKEAKTKRPNWKYNHNPTPRLRRVYAGGPNASIVLGITTNNHVVTFDHKKGRWGNPDNRTQVESIGIGVDGTLWYENNGALFRRIVGTTQAETVRSNKTIQDIAVGSQDSVWGIGMDGKLYRWRFAYEFLP